MTPERLAECRECRAIVTQLLAVEPAGRCPDHGFVTLHDAQHAHIRDLEAQLAAAREQSIDDCLYHRCVEHWTVPKRNDTASTNGAECGACIERDLLASKLTEVCDQWESEYARWNRSEPQP